MNKFQLVWFLFFLFLFIGSQNAFAELWSLSLKSTVIAKGKKESPSYILIEGSRVTNVGDKINFILQKKEKFVRKVEAVYVGKNQQLINGKPITQYIFNYLNKKKTQPFLIFTNDDTFLNANIEGLDYYVARPDELPLKSNQDLPFALSRCKDSFR
jgi:hypothetical protein